jgi:hypothetical protein
MAEQTVTVRRGGRVYRATWSLTQGYVRVLSPFGMAEARTKETPEGTAATLLDRLVDLWEQQPR